MSLKAFHVFFITVCIAFALFMCGWGIHSYSTTGSRENLALGLISLIGGGVMVAYSFWFMKKVKKMGGWL